MKTNLTYDIYVHCTVQSFQLAPDHRSFFSTVGWRGIGTGSSKCLHTSSTRHTAFRNRPIGVVAVHSWKTYFSWLINVLLALYSIISSRVSVFR